MWPDLRGIERVAAINAGGKHRCTDMQGSTVCTLAVAGWLVQAESMAGNLAGQIARCWPGGAPAKW